MGEMTKEDREEFMHIMTANDEDSMKKIWATRHVTIVSDVDEDEDEDDDVPPLKTSDDHPK